MNWTFGGASCAAAGVDSIRIQVSGPSDGATKTVTCSSAPSAITIDNFIPDTCTVDIAGLDAAGNELYGMSAPKTVTIAAGANTYSIDVPALTGDLTVYWGNFRTYTGCGPGQPNIPTIRVRLEDRSGNVLDDQTYACGNDGVTWNKIDAGTYTVVLNGIASDGLVHYASKGQVLVNASQANDSTVDLAESSASLTVLWTIAGSSSCGSVAQVHLVITDANGNTFDNNIYRCSDGGETYANAPAGGYTVTAQGLDGGGSVLYSGTNANVNVTTGASATYTVDMH